VVLTVVAAPDVVSLPAFMPPVMSPAGVGGLNRRITKDLVVGTPRGSAGREGGFIGSLLGNLQRMLLDDLNHGSGREMVG
jgi:hypothetical protein